jgi:hypothetical protein
MEGALKRKQEVLGIEVELERLVRVNGLIKKNY